MPEIGARRRSAQIETPKFGIGDKVVLMKEPEDHPVWLPIGSTGVVREVKPVGRTSFSNVGVEWDDWEFGHSRVTGGGYSGWWVRPEVIECIDTPACDIVLTIANVEGKYVAFDKRGEQYCSDPDISSLLFELGSGAEEGYFNG